MADNYTEARLAYMQRTENAPMAPLARPERSYSYDVIVCGGGTSGVAAAIAAVVNALTSRCFTRIPATPLSAH